MSTVSARRGHGPQAAEEGGRSEARASGGLWATATWVCSMGGVPAVHVLVRQEPNAGRRIGDAPARDRISSIISTHAHAHARTRTRSCTHIHARSHTNLDPNLTGTGWGSPVYAYWIIFRDGDTTH